MLGAYFVTHKHTLDIASYLIYDTDQVMNCGVSHACLTLQKTENTEVRTYS